MDAQQLLKEFKGEFDPVLDAYLVERVADVRQRDGFTGEGLERCKDMIMSGGKRLRPALMTWAYEGFGGTDRDAILHAAMSVELIHAFLLIHDDIMDRDDVRHGAQTLHALYKERLTSLIGADESVHAGNSIALVFGDLVGALGNHTLFSAQFPADRIMMALTHLQETISYTCMGQLKDVMFEYAGEAQVDEVLSMYEYKTARYTIESPMILGAILAGASDDVREQVAAFARPLGVAFQIRDDVIGLYGDAGEIGKPVGSDIAEGKITILVALTRTMAEGADAKRLEELLGTDVSEAEIDEFRAIVERSGARTEAERRGEAMIAESMTALDALACTPEVRARLLSVAQYLTQRTV